MSDEPGTGQHESPEEKMPDGYQQILVKCPTGTSILGIEITGDLCILHIMKKVFGEMRELTQVYKRMK